MKSRLIVQSLIFTIIIGFAFTTAAQDTLFVDDFENGTGNWNITNDGGECVWDVIELATRPYTMPPEAVGWGMTADSDSCGSESTLLSTATMVNPLNLSNYSYVWIEFDNDWRTISTSDEAYVEISNDGGNTWITVVSWLGVDRRNTHEVWDVSTYAASHSDVRLRLRVIQPGWHWWWAVDNFAVYSDTTAVSVEDETSNIPREFYLSQNYPNPFNPSTTISFKLPESGRVILKIYNIMGEEIKTLVEGYREAGIYEVEFSAIGGSASGGNASALASGMYLYRLSTNGFTETKKLLLLK